MRALRVLTKSYQQNKNSQRADFPKEDKSKPRIIIYNDKDSPQIHNPSNIIQKSASELNNDQNESTIAHNELNQNDHNKSNHAHSIDIIIGKQENNHPNAETDNINQNNYHNNKQPEYTIRSEIAYYNEYIPVSPPHPYQKSSFEYSDWSTHCNNSNSRYYESYESYTRGNDNEEHNDIYKQYNNKQYNNGSNGSMFLNDSNCIDNTENKCNYNNHNH
eukprot:Pgem_evm1s3665